MLLSPRRSVRSGREFQFVINPFFCVNWCTTTWRGRGTTATASFAGMLRLICVSETREMIMRGEGAGKGIDEERARRRRTRQLYLVESDDDRR